MLKIYFRQRTCVGRVVTSMEGVANVSVVGLGCLGHVIKGYADIFILGKTLLFLHS